MSGSKKILQMKRRKNRIEQIGDCTLHLGDGLEIVPTLAAPAAVVTSPPYGQLRDYGKIINDWRALVSGILCPTPDRGDTQILVNLGLIHGRGEVVPYWNDLIDDMRADGWRHYGWYVWDKLNGMPSKAQGRLGSSFEFIFHFNRAARGPNKIVPTKCDVVSSHRFRRRDGLIRPPNSPHLIGQPYKIPDNVIRLSPEKNNTTGHPAVFPVELPKQLAEAFTHPGETVLDPFMGSGTTGVACIQSGRAFVGIELHEPYFDTACRRIEAAAEASHNVMRMAA